MIKNKGRRHILKTVGISTLGAAIATSAMRDIAEATAGPNSHYFGISGNAVVAENPNWTQKTVRGWGTSYQADAGVGDWFHVCVPVPSKISGVDVLLKSIQINFQSGVNNVRITQVNLYDGFTYKQTFNPNVSGDLQVTGWSPSSLSPFQVLAGLGISMQVTWSGSGSILFSGFSAGLG